MLKQQQQRPYKIEMASFLLLCAALLGSPNPSGALQPLSLSLSLARRSSSGVLRMSGEEDRSSSAGRRKMAWPFDAFEAPTLLTGELAGDAGFDPLGIIKSRDQLFFLREAEIKHARIAMLAALGWPLSELYHYKLSQAFQMSNLLSNSKAPSVLNGGLDNIFVLSALLVFAIVGAGLEIILARRKNEVTSENLRAFFDMFNENGFDIPGNYDFDPLQLAYRLCGNDRQKKLFLQTIEIFNGRMSMLAVLGYLTQEYFTNQPVVDEIPQFFRPFWEDF